VGLETRGVPIAEMGPERQMLLAAMQGNYRFKPRGSVETADIRSQRSDLVQFMQVVGQTGQTWPMLAQFMNTPSAVRSLLEQLLRVFRFPDRQAVLGSDAQAAMQQAMMPPPGMPGAVPGMPPPAGLPPGTPIPPPGFQPPNSPLT
jgi:hypothetical protein